MEQRVRTQSLNFSHGRGEMLRVGSVGRARLASPVPRAELRSTRSGGVTAGVVT